MNITSPDGVKIEVREIQLTEIDRVPLRCWKDRETIRRLFETQGTIGMAAWAGDTCVGQLHGYRLDLPDGGHDHWPDWNKPTWVKDRPAELNITGPAWAHACVHVGRTIETWLTECAPQITRYAAECDWDAERISERLAPHCFSDDQLHELIDRAKRGVQPGGLEWGADTNYCGRGIGTAMCKASVEWARRNGYVAVLATASPDGLRAFCRLAGGLPQRTYTRLGFETIAVEGDASTLPDWINHMPEIKAEVDEALAAGRSIESLHSHLMALRLA